MMMAMKNNNTNNNRAQTLKNHALKYFHLSNNKTTTPIVNARSVSEQTNLNGILLLSLQYNFLVVFSIGGRL